MADIEYEMDCGSLRRETASRWEPNPYKERLAELQGRPSNVVDLLAASVAVPQEATHETSRSRARAADSRPRPSVVLHSV